jgi:hypothetical protein
MKPFKLALLLVAEEVVDCKTEDSGRRLYRRDDKVEIRARLRRKIIKRWMQRIERKSLTKPIRKEDLQASTLNQRFDSKFQELCAAVTSKADSRDSGLWRAWRFGWRNFPVLFCTLVCVSIPLQTLHEF